MKNKIVKLIPVLLFSLLLTGCWDNVEIDRKAFVSTIGIDVGADIEHKNELIGSQNENSDIKGNYKEFNILQVTYGFPDIRNMEKQNGSAEELSITVNGYSMTDTYFKALAKSSRSLHFGHSKLLLLSEELFKYPTLIQEITDYIQREPNLNRTIIMAVVKGKSKDYIQLKPTMEANIDSYITALMGNSSKNGVVSPVTLTKYIDMIKTYNAGVLPVFSLKGEDDIELTGVAIIEDSSIKDYLNNNQVTDIQILKGDIGSCRKSINENGHPVDYYIKSVNTDLDISYENNKLHLNYKVDAEGSLKGYYTDSEVLDSDAINKIEEEFNISMEKELEETYRFVIDELNIDLLQVGSNVRRYHRGIWKEVEDNWMEVLNDAEISISVNNNIRTVGISN
ncbi:Ger(x)C family spore germination protein [Clostridium sp.]|uniref:Ger(x)C family spore germination protein n=1 Tax=Clostridium sp. TaxID=1506 RepID=UPI003217A098